MGTAGLTTKRILMPPSPSIEQMQLVGQASTRWGMASILILFIAGGILLYFVDEQKGKQEAAYLAEIY
jgi:UMF1 family MFS transporter